MASSNNPWTPSLRTGSSPSATQGPVRRHPGRLRQSPPVDQGPELDYTPDEYSRVVHYGPGHQPLCGQRA